MTMKITVFAAALSLACIPALASAAGNLPYDDIGLIPKKSKPTAADDTFYKSKDGLAEIAYMMMEEKDTADDIAATEALDNLRQNLQQSSVFAMTQLPPATAE